jgi:transcriptional regulator with XRE-family HTH domain
MNTRLKQFLAAENITQAHFADTINVVRASVSHVLSGRNNPSFDFVKAMMIHYPDLNIEWLMFGKGKMYKEKTAAEIPLPDPSPACDQLFPDIEPEVPSGVSNTVQEIKDERNFEPTTVLNTLGNTVQSVEKQRKVSKILILFDDGTYQEM